MNSSNANGMIYFAAHVVGDSGFSHEEDVGVMVRISEQTACSRSGGMPSRHHGDGLAYCVSGFDVLPTRVFVPVAAELAPPAE